MSSADLDDVALDAHRMEAVARRSRDVAPLLKVAAKHKEALKLALSDPPSGTKNEDIKVSVLAAVFAGPSRAPHQFPSVMCDSCS